MEGDYHQRPGARHAEHPKNFVFPIGSVGRRRNRLDNWVEIVSVS
jgi:hypothetical protein